MPQYHTGSEIFKYNMKIDLFRLDNTLPDFIFNNFLKIMIRHEVFRKELAYVHDLKNVLIVGG